MALGDSYDSNKQKYFDPNVYSAYNVGNSAGIDPSAVNYTMYGGLLKISISPLKQNNGDKIAYDHDNAAAVWLTHTKAKMFIEEIKRVLEGKIHNGGVPTGKEGLITFSDGKEFGITTPALVILKVDDQGNVTSSYMYQFKADHYYGVENFDTKTSKFGKNIHANVEVDQLITILDEYQKAMSGGAAYGNMYYDRFETTRENTKLDLIMSKLGVEYKPGTTSRQSTSSYFNNQQSGGFNSNSSDQRGMVAGSLDDLE